MPMIAEQRSRGRVGVTFKICPEDTATLLLGHLDPRGLEERTCGLPAPSQGLSEAGKGILQGPAPCLHRPDHARSHLTRGPAIHVAAPRPPASWELSYLITHLLFQAAKNLLSNLLHNNNHLTQPGFLWVF